MAHGDAVQHLMTHSTVATLESPPRRIVLVADDEPIVARMIGEMSLFLGLGEPRIAYTFTEAIAIVEDSMSRGIEIVASVVDFKMPDGRPDRGMPGRRPLLAMLRELGMHPVLFSGHLPDDYEAPDGVPVFHKGDGPKPLMEWLKGRSEAACATI